MEKVLDNHLAYARIDTWIRSMHHKYPSTFESPFSYPWWTTCEVLAAKELFSETTTDPDSFLADVKKPSGYFETPDSVTGLSVRFVGIW